MGMAVLSGSIIGGPYKFRVYEVKGRKGIPMTRSFVQQVLEPLSVQSHTHHKQKLA